MRHVRSFQAFLQLSVLCVDFQAADKLDKKDQVFLQYLFSFVPLVILGALEIKQYGYRITFLCCNVNRFLKGLYLYEIYSMMSLGWQY